MLKLLYSWMVGALALAAVAADTSGHSGLTRTYCVIDISGGSKAVQYPVTYLDDVPAGGWTDEYKTKKIVLRRIDKPTGTYYAGVFEVTEAQWDSVMGGTSTSTKPKAYVSYNAIRGNARTYDWPSSDAVAAVSFMGRLRERTGLAALDLPSEDEWEYAARAGVTTDWLCGDSETGLGDYAWYPANSGNATHPVGTRRANAWGLYDVHGNVYEWCLNRHPSGSSNRVLCGGAYNDEAWDCTFEYRDYGTPSSDICNNGFRLFCRGDVGGTATELEYSGGIYCYGTYKGGGANEVTLVSATRHFELEVVPDGFPGKSENHVAVPVVLKSGAVTSENVAISLEGVSHPGELSAAKIYDDRAFMKMVCPADTSKWEDGGDVWEYEKGNEYREWPGDVWPDKVPVSNRYWVLAQVNAGCNWSGLTHLRIAVRDDVHGSLAPAVVPLLRGGVADDFPGDRIFGGSDMAVKPLSKSWWVTFRSDLTWADDSARPWFDYCTASDGGSMPIDVRGAGVLRVEYIIEGDDELRVRGKNIVSSEVTERDWSTRCLEVEVSAATTLTVYNEDWSDVYIREISFWPSGSRCVRLAADYVERCGLDDGCGLPYLRGYVLGSGVYRSGETATLTAVAGNAAAFVRWESDDVAIDSAAATNACLSFTVPDSVCAAAAARAEVRIRAVWRDRLPGEVGPKPSYGLVPGDPVSLDIPDLVGYAAKGLPAGLKFDSKTGRVTGAAAKPTGEAGVTVTFTKKGAETFTTQIVVGPFPVLSVSAPDAPASCKVTGAGAYAAGKRVTLRATAAKGFVFAGWYADAVFRTPLAGDVDFRTPNYPYVMPREDITLFARFVPADEDAAALRLPSVASEYAPNEAVELALDVSGCVSLPTVKVAGLPPGLKFTAKALDVKATKTAPAAHYDANTIYGAPTKSGVYAATVTVTTAGKRTATETILFAVVDRDRDEYILKITSDATKGRVTGAGVYAKGKKVALRATPAKGFVFAGWYADTDFTKSLMDDSDYRTPSLPYEMPGSDVTVHARFLPAEEDGGIALSVNGQTAAEEAPGSVYHASGEWRMELSVSSASLPTVTLTGLPAGLKFTAKGLDVKATATTPAAHYDAYTVYGTATRPGTYPVKARITNATVKKAVERWFTIVVDNLTDANGLLLVTDAVSGEPVPLRNARGEKYTVYAGVAEHGLPAITPFEESDKLTVSGLPAGLRYDAKLRKFTGVPTKAGTYTVTTTVRSGCVSSVSTFTVEVVALPAWAIGTFVGSGVCELEGYTPFTNNLHGTIAVAANGRVSGKVVFDTGDDSLLTATVSEPSLTGYDEGTKRYYCDVYLLFKDGHDVIDERIRRLYIADENFAVGSLVQKVGWGWMDGCVDEETGVEIEDGFELDFSQNAWKRKDFEGLPQFAAKKTTVAAMDAPLPPDPSEPEVNPGTADLTLDIAPNGTVAATLALVDGSKVKKFTAKGDLIVVGYESADESETGRSAYAAYVSLVFGNLGLLHAEIEMDVPADGGIRAEDCRIVSVDRFATEVGRQAYCVIDLSEGPDAAIYPVGYLAGVPVGGWTDDYKMTKLVLRRIDKPTGVYYAGVFEVTEAQWANVMGGTSTSTKPKGSVSYNTIRGDAGTYDWPSSDAVDADSFMGRLRAKTGLSKLDLPSEEEWEYAARAGVTTRWLCGDDATDLGDYAWYSVSSGNAKRSVGTLQPNAWGLYDVHGNVWEWCLELYSNDASDSLRVLRGGAYNYDASLCAFAYRDRNRPSIGLDNCGFRLFFRSESN